MAIRQLNVFIENKRGALVDITRDLAANGIDIRALSVADTAEFGILRMIVSDVDRAKDLLSNLGCIVTVCDVVGVRLDDTPGKLAGALDVLDKADINLEYLYAFLTKAENSACVVFRVADNAAAEAALAAAGFSLVSDSGVAGL